MFSERTKRLADGEHETGNMEWTILQGADVNACPCRLTPLQTAAQFWDEGAVELLLQRPRILGRVRITRRRTER
jgi:hypothetical protein